MKEFEVSYGGKTFGGMIKAGVLTVEADNITDVQEKAMEMVLQSINDSYEEDEEIFKDGSFDLQNLNVSVTEKK